MKHHRILIKLITKGRLNGSDGLFTIIRFSFISRNNRQSACCCRRNPAAFFDGFHDKKGRLKHYCVSDGLCLYGSSRHQTSLLSAAFWRKRKPNSRNCLSSTWLGASTSKSCARWVFGKAITSRMRSGPRPPLGLPRLVSGHPWGRFDFFACRGLDLLN